MCSNLYALEIDPTPEQDVDAGAEGQESFLSEITASIPGIDEAMARPFQLGCTQHHCVVSRSPAAQSFAEVLKQVQTLSFDVVVFDTAPTGHTLRLLQLPATLEKSLGKLMSLQSGLGGMVSSLMAMIGGAGGDVSEENMFTKLQGLKEMVEHVNAQFRDASLTTFVCVACPEFLSLYETERLVQELARNDIDVRLDRARCSAATCLTRMLCPPGARNSQVHNVIINQVRMHARSVRHTHPSSSPAMTQAARKHAGAVPREVRLLSANGSPYTHARGVLTRHTLTSVCAAAQSHAAVPPP